jgi:hypothetical protein
VPSRWDDDDDWVGTPPEGHHTRDQSNPGYWKRQWPAQTIFFGLLGVLFVVVIVLAVVR